ncbi:unnamed protein product [Boreogadus saida]
MLLLCNLGEQCGCPLTAPAAEGTFDPKLQRRETTCKDALRERIWCSEVGYGGPIRCEDKGGSSFSGWLPAMPSGAEALLYRLHHSPTPCPDK